MIDLDFITLLKYSVLAGATQILLTVLWNIFIHPLSDFPGPKWAAATDWYKTYQEAICQKSWFTVLEELHAQYGMVCSSRVVWLSLWLIDCQALLFALVLVRYVHVPLCCLFGFNRD
jgi:hypothetical protein